ncbi:unnamed protein product [Chondrus crispus]|uniref:Uncharacterized protein n=1 Tax=Chondrus crispus TaxID=2769 RepID=R7Q5M8_CHOCR|nr:unnamed protein product [Chondrus crispus]CDF32770.1 unnamed protein product [Chondrus crispus]|eukprot:XP_005712571.1 unnamed protein product [Chondrus crispus]
MEVVLLGSALSNLCALLIDAYASRAQRPLIQPPAEPDTTTQRASNSKDRVEAAPASDANPQEADAEQFPEGSIPALEKKVKHLRAEAKRVNAPDTFVQYARLTREANKVEKELTEKKALEPSDTHGTVLPDVMAMLSKAVTPQAQSSMKRRAQFMVLKAIVRALPFLLLWWYFSPFGYDRGPADALVIDCRAFRPLSFIFSKREPSCGDDHWMCAAQPPQCAVSYWMVLVLANTVFPMIFQAFV